MNHVRHWALLGLSSVVLACSGSEGSGPEWEATGEVAEAATCPDVSGTNSARSLAIVDATALSKFGFARTVNRIRTTANVASTSTSVGIYQRWMKTFGASAAAGDCDDPSIDPNGYDLVCPRTNELLLSTVNPFAATSAVTFQPVAIMNRFDLAPASGATCGEYRIVYAMSSTDPAISGRAFIIFEAALPNPTPALGLEACLPVAQFWQGLSQDGSATSRATKLEKFYFTGGAVPGFAPAVDAAHYGLAQQAATQRTSGQVRTNFFVNDVEWHLREFKLRRNCTAPADVSTCSLSFEHVTVKENPAEELFGGTHPRSDAFVTNFLSQVPLLAASNVNLIKMKTGANFNEFESISQAAAVRYAAPGVTNTATRDAIKQKLTSIGSTLTVNNILERATTQTCAGCHQVSNALPLGGGLTWPSTNGFVHVDEQKALSPALTTTFLPRRKVVLERFINDRCDGSTPAPVAEGMTVGGSPEGAAN
ncbi:MAG TPA: hypothetical protein VER33_10740 [Polyangiaceae bacterium]|nr:hypothetical protein [Polyangiaceae bacterium]